MGEGGDNEEGPGLVTGESGELVSVREEVSEHGRPLGRVIHGMGRWLARPSFFVGLLSLHLLWILVNTFPIGPLEAWDPPPFTLLATLASIEGPLLTLLVLMRQVQDRHIAELRGETQLQVSLHVEHRTKAALARIAEVKQALGLATDEQELRELQRPLDPKKLIEQIREQMGKEGEEQPGR